MTDPFARRVTDDHQEQRDGGSSSLSVQLACAIGLLSRWCCGSVHTSPVSPYDAALVARSRRWTEKIGTSRQWVFSRRPARCVACSGRLGPDAITVPAKASRGWSAALSLTDACLGFDPRPRSSRSFAWWCVHAPSERRHHCPDGGCIHLRPGHHEVSRLSRLPM